jgi:hypothetical protein
MEGSGTGLTEDNSAFAWRICGKTRQTSVGTASLRARPSENRSKSAHHPAAVSTEDYWQVIEDERV